MKEKIKEIAIDNNLVGFSVNEVEVSWGRSAFNISMSIYFVFAIFAAVSLLLFFNEYIG